MTNEGKKGIFRTNLSLALSLTGLHGFAYLVHSRSRLERDFWTAAIAVFMACSTVVCYNSFKRWADMPVVNVVETFNYDASNVPMPAISICPDQRLDEYHNLAIELNRIRLRCRLTTENSKHVDLPLCNETDLVAVRAPDSPFYGFQQELAKIATKLNQDVGEQ